MELLLKFGPPVLTFVLGLFIPKLTGVQKDALRTVAYALGELSKIIRKYLDGKVERKDVEHTLKSAGEAYQWFMDIFGDQENKQHKDSGKKKTRTSVKLCCILVPLILVFTTGCAAYRKHVAPKIPTIRLEGSVGGEGLGGSVGFESRWTGEERKRSIEVQPELDAAD